jgi:hypothetical protein
MNKNSVTKLKKQRQGFEFFGGCSMEHITLLGHHVIRIYGLGALGLEVAVRPYRTIYVGPI